MSAPTKKLLSWITKEKKTLGSFIDPARWLNVSSPPLHPLLGVWRRFNEGQLQGHHFLKNPSKKYFLPNQKNKKETVNRLTQVVERHDIF